MVADDIGQLFSCLISGYLFCLTPHFHLLSYAVMS